MTKRQKVQEARLSEIEEEFLTLLRSCLRECAQGRWGLFGQNDHLDLDGRYWGWPDARHHPAVTAGTTHLDYELLRVIPARARLDSRPRDARWASQRASRIHLLQSNRKAVLRLAQKVELNP